MSIENGKDYRNWLNNPEQHMAIKEARRMLKFKCRVFRTALYTEKKNYEKLLSGIERREKAYKPRFKTREELDAAYVVGAVSDEDYMQQRSAIWQCYSDRGHIANIEWLEKELAKYESALADLDQWRKDARQESVRKYEQKRSRAKRFNTYRRNRYRRQKREQLERRWKYYGIG